MASVHESLYFNPMMTNGVVHANIFGIKDWVTPYKIAVLVLLHEMSTTKPMALLDRRRLNKLILPLQQGPDLTLEQFLKIVEECCLRMVNAVKLRLLLMADGELQDMEHFFTILPNAFSDSEAFKTSVVGLFMRQMLLAYNKLSFSQYLASLGIQSLVKQGAKQGMPANKLLDALRGTDIMHWKQSLSELIEISLAQTTSIWRMYGKSTMARQQAQLLLNMNSLEPVNFSVQQNNTEAFAVALCHLADLHAEQGLYAVVSDIMKHLKQQFPPHTQHAKLWMLCDLKIQFEKAMNDGKYHLAEPHVTAISALNSTEGLYRKAQLLKALNQTSEASKILQQLQQQCEKSKNIEMTIRVMLASAELHWDSSGFATALPLLLQALSLSRQHNLQRLTSETLLHLAFTQLMLGIPEQALVLVQDVLESVLAHGSLIDKGRALLLAARCQMALAGAAAQEHRLTALEQAVHTLDEAAVYFSQLDCKERMRDIHYLQARLHHTLGNIAQRNKCSMLFRLLDQELPSSGMTVVSHL
ncbi:anaphase-promoting complex subunit 5 [Sinocyclocheilus rhinocerous]|uniref:anaphase-promoting complex subunit 5 n=1 Tax=Sinocyclocheilus rhinocerous TaxID=307959 RepID=UPI0007B79DDD|nr:PREDICTED: anaphase-promoting complex subunit 5 [Sinocyclocheilus rhinocerous]